VRWRIGRTDEAVDLLYRSYEKREPDFLLFYADPVFDGLRGNARYEELIELLVPTT
jgi:hypothetical protein